MRAVQRGEAVECQAEAGVVRAEGLLVGRQGLTIKRLGLRVAALLPVQIGEGGAHGRGAGIVGPELPLAPTERFLHERLGLPVPARLVERHSFAKGLHGSIGLGRRECRFQDQGSEHQARQQVRSHEPPSFPHRAFVGERGGYHRERERARPQNRTTARPEADQAGGEMVEDSGRNAPECPASAVLRSS